MLSSTSHMLRLATHPGKRALHDLASIGSNKTVVSQGPPGYSAVSGNVVTVFGCTGFLGRYLVAKLAKMGTQVIVPYREEYEKRVLKPMGDLGQIVSMEWDIRNERQIEECVRHSDIVYNLVGRDYETKNFDYTSVHVTGAQRIASIAAQSGVTRFVHVSHLNASLDSKSKFYRSKAEGEERVRSVFPEATIVRPGSMFGYEDKLLNNIAVWPIWWKLNHGETKIRPVHVFDVAQALANLLTSPPLPRTLSLPGPSTLTFSYLLDLVSTITYNPPSRAPVVPKPIALALARVAQAVWWPALCPDEVERRFMDDVGVDGGVDGDWEAVGVRPEEIEQYALTYLRRFRSAENYIRPTVFPSREPATD